MPMASRQINGEVLRLPRIRSFPPTIISLKKAAAGGMAEVKLGRPGVPPPPPDKLAEVMTAGLSKEGRHFVLVWVSGNLSAKLRPIQAKIPSTIRRKMRS